MAQSYTEEELRELSSQILGCAIAVAKKLRPRYLEKVYENALAHELRKQGLAIERQVGLDVIYDDIVVGQYIADILVENLIILELKATETIGDEHIAQALNYLTTTGWPLCLILNFGSLKLGIKRVRL